MERLTAKLARLRATANADVRSGRAQVEFRRKEAVRLETLRNKKHVPEKDDAQAVVERRLAEFSLEASETEQRIA